MKKLLVSLILISMSLCISCTAEKSPQDSSDKGESTVSVEDTTNQSSARHEVKEEREKTEEVATEGKSINSTEVNQEYGVKVDVTINKIASKSEIGVIKNIVEREGKAYIEVDILEFYRGEEALNEALKDGNAQYDEELGKYYIPDGYYIRNIDEEITTYELAEDVEYYLCAYDVGNLMENSATDVSVSKEQFIEYINKSSEYDYMSCNRAKLFWIDTTNNLVKSLAKQYTP